MPSDSAPHGVPSEGARTPLDHPGWPNYEAWLEDEDAEVADPDCETGGNPFHRHTAHCFGMDDPIRGEL